MAKRTGRGSTAIVVKNGSGGEDIRLARAKLKLVPTTAAPISMLAQKLFGGKSAFMEFARLAVHIDVNLAPVVEAYESLPGPQRAAVSIDEICVRYDIDPLHFIGVVGEAVKKYGQNAAIVIASLSFPDVVSRSVKQALTKDGFKDREALMKNQGFVPIPRGHTINVNANAAARADASSAPESKGLPSFEKSMRDSDDIVRDRE